MLLSVIGFDVMKVYTFLGGAKFLRMLNAVEEGCKKGA